MAKKLFIVVNIDWTFLNYRKEIALAAQQQGYEVTIVTKDTGAKAEIESLGMGFIDLPMSRSSLNPLDALKTSFFLFRLYKKQKPDIIHQVGLKIILLGSFTARLARVNALLNAVNGLGILFSEDNPSRLSKFLFPILRFGHKQKRLAVIFQNKEDKSLFIDNKIINETQAYHTNGSGVNLNFYNFVPEQEHNFKLIVLFAARMIKEKGVFELIEAANTLREKYEDKVTFLLCGGVDDNPNAISKETLEQCCDKEYLQWLGYRKDMKDLLEKSHIIAFPSYYREGIPKSLIEACAAGRPIITTNSIGCKDTVIDGYNGFLIPIKDSKALAEKLDILIGDKDLRTKMGENSRALAEREFSIENVIEKHIEIYNRLTK